MTMPPTVAIRRFLVWLLTCFAATTYCDLVLAQQPRGPGGDVGVDVNGEPRFVVKAISFQAFDETSYDFLGSDEVVFMFGTPLHRTGPR
jgi:hypothetical protein